MLEEKNCDEIQLLSNANNEIYHLCGIWCERIDQANWWRLTGTLVGLRPISRHLLDT